MSQSQKSSFKILVCGAGIAGLCAGIGLAQKGHNVTILESAHELVPIGIGIHLPPNATLVLKHFGLLEKLSKDAMYPSKFIFRRWEDDKIISQVQAGGKPSSQTPLPYWTMRRSDYQRNLYEAAIAAGCGVRLNSRIASLDADLPSVTLVNGEVIQADFVVVADGIKSKLRDFLIPEERISLALNPMSSYRAYVSHDDLLSDPATASIFEETATNVWAGSNRHVIVYPCGGGLYTLGATHFAKDAKTMEWTQVARSEEAREEFKNFSPVVDRIFSHSKDIKQWRLAEVPRLPRWTSKSGKAALIGDAAHAMIQFLAQGAAMATEDAAALAECIGEASCVEDLPNMARAYERSRKWRCEIVQAQSRRSGEMIHMPDGEEQENRDMKMAGLCVDSFWDVELGPLMDAKFRTFLYGHDVLDHTRSVLRGFKKEDRDLLDL